MKVSTQRFSRVLWVVLDGMGFEHVRLALASGGHPAITRIGSEGLFLPTRPAHPVCQTPPALLALFTGTQPQENGVWGYYMPHPDGLEESMSGFSADTSGTRTIWQEMEEQGQGYSLMNVAFRNDPVWSGPARHLVFGYDGYRLWQKPSRYRLRRGEQEIVYRGIRLRARSSTKGVTLAKGASLRAEVPAGELRKVDITRGTSVYAHLLEPGELFLNPVSTAVCRGETDAQSGGFLDMSNFHLVRRLNASRDQSRRVPVEPEILASRISFDLKDDLMLRGAANRTARLVVGYFPVIDDFNHAYLDLFLRKDARATALFHVCVTMVDGLLKRLMQRMQDDELLVISSDHGGMPFSSMLHVNEILADAGLVRRGARGYDFRRSLAWYHPSDCGQVVAWDLSRREALLKRLRAALDIANTNMGADIGLLEGDGDSPYLAFLYPRGDTYFTGRPGRGSGLVRDRKRSGGHHLSPLSPTPWMQAVLGLWSPRSSGVADSLPFLPKENIDMKRFLMETMELA